jgi:putative intracellular protease/amidase
VAGPIDFLNDLSFTEKINLAIISNTLDPVTTFVDLPEVNKAGSNFVQTVNPTHTFADPPSNLDVLLVPGGFGTRAPDPFFDDTIQYIKDVYPSLQYLLSVCTGATLVGRAGLLDNRRATTNKKAWKFATSFGKNVTWEPVARWVVDDNIWSTSGIAAGIDGLLGLVEHIYDADTSIALANDLEYEWHNDPAWDPFGAIWNVPGANGTQAEVTNTNIYVSSICDSNHIPCAAL